MTNDPQPAVFYCPIDDCEYSAPTERQIRSHITLADHGDHEDANGYSVELDVRDRDGGTHAYTNKIQLDDIEFSDITDSVSESERLVLKTAYENPDLNYTQIHEKIQAKHIDHAYSKVRRLIQTHIEAKPSVDETTNQSSVTEPSGNSSGSAESATEDTDSGEEVFDFGINEHKPLSASPSDDTPSTEDGSGPSTTSTSDGTTTASEQTDQPASGGQTIQSTAAQDTIQLDRTGIPDYWHPKYQTIIATYEALDDPTAKEVHAALPDELDSDPSWSVVSNVITSWKKDTYDELTSTEKDAIDALVDKTDTDTLVDVADQHDLNAGTLKYVRALYPHILAEQTDSSITSWRLQPLRSLPFDTPADLDTTGLTPLQEAIISCYEERKPIRNRDVHAILEDHGVSVARETIQQTLSRHTNDRYYHNLSADKKTYDDLTDRQQRAVDHITNVSPETTIQQIASQVDETDGYLYFVNNNFDHIIDARRENIN